MEKISRGRRPAGNKADITGCDKNVSLFSHYGYIFVYHNSIVICIIIIIIIIINDVEHI